MAFLFRPSIVRQNMIYELPRPVTQCKLQDTWDQECLKIPLRDGNRTVGQSQNGMEIHLAGEVASHAGTVMLGEQEMFEALVDLRTMLDVSAETGPLDFYLYFDEATNTFRSFRGCSPVRFEWDLSNPQLFTWSAVLHADQPQLFETSPFLPPTS